MRRSAGTLAVSLLLSVALPAAGIAAAADPGEQIMLARANYWRSQHRLDLAGDILGKILAVNPNQPDALYQRGLLAQEQGDRGGAAQYFDRLRQLAPADTRAAQLAAASAEPGAQSASAPVVTEVAAAPAVAAPPLASVAPAAPAAARPEPASFAVASADSDDLVGTAPPALPAPPPPAHLADGAPLRQVASLPETTISDDMAPISVRASDLTPAASGNSPRAVQVAQVEIEPPPPINGLQPLGVLRPYSPSDTLETYIDRDLERLEMQANPTLVAGFGYRTHTGAEGLGRLDEYGGAVEIGFSPWYTGTARIDILPVHLDAGTPANGNLNIFGANPVLIASGLQPAGAGDQSVTGVGLLGSYTFQDFSGQFGTTPLGFPVTNLVGDIAYTPKFLDGNLAVRIEGLRQPVTDSVISYAGTHANLVAANAVTGGAFGGYDKVYGGVVKTGPHVLAYYDDQLWGYYGGVGYSWFTGTNVVDNSAVDALIGGYYRPYKSDWLTLRTGVSLFYTGYHRNVNGSTYGQGGYFSPQNFEGLGFPVEVTGNVDRWSYLASVTLGIQTFNQDSGPIFPNNPNAQAYMQAVAPSIARQGGLTSGIGLGFNLKGQVEYAIDKTASVGLAGSYNNGNSYDEAIVQVYLRKTFDWFAPLAAKNDAHSIVMRDQPMSRL